MVRQLALGALAPMPAPKTLVIAWSPALDRDAKTDAGLRDRCNGLFESLFLGKPCPAGWSVSRQSGGEAEGWVSHDPDVVARRVDHPYLTNGSGTCAWCGRREHRSGVCAMVAMMYAAELTPR